MNKEDRDETREMLKDIMSVHAAEMNGRFNVLHSNLIQIKEQVTVANGRTKTLESAVIELKMSEKEHVLNCPMNQKIMNLETDMIKRNTVLAFTVKMLVAAGTVLGLIIAIMELKIK